MHCGDIGGEIGTGTVRNQKDAAEIHIVVHEHPPDMIHARAHIIELLPDRCLRRKSVFQ